MNFGLIKIDEAYITFVVLQDVSLCKLGEYELDNEV